MSLREITIRDDLTWVGAGQTIKALLQLVSVLTLARILTPTDYGLMAMASAITVFATIFREFGTASAIIHIKQIDQPLKSTVFWFNLGVGFILAALVALSARPVSQFYGEPRVLWVLIALSPTFIFSSLSIVQQAMLERESAFRPVVMIEVGSTVAALVLAISAALEGAGVFALVINSLAVSVIATLLYWIKGHWQPSLHFELAALQRIWKYSSNVFIFNIVNYAQRNTDSVLIGRFLGSSGLGHYNLAYRLLLFPLQLITASVSRVVFPAYSRSRSTDTIGPHYLNTLAKISFITAPLVGVVWMTRDLLIMSLLGEKWLPTADIIAWLAPVGFFQSMVSTSGSVLNAVGRPDILRNLGIAALPILVTGIFVGLPWGVVGVATGYCIANAIWVYPVISTVLKQLNRNFGDFIFKVYRPAIVATTIGVAGYLLIPAVTDPLMSWVLLATSTTVYILTYSLVMWLWSPTMARSFLTTLR